jgi:hypothetical protein
MSSLVFSSSISIRRRWFDLSINSLLKDIYNPSITGIEIVVPAVAFLLVCENSSTGKFLCFFVAMNN